MISLTFCKGGRNDEGRREPVLFIQTSPRRCLGSQLIVTGGSQPKACWDDINQSEPRTSVSGAGLGCYSKRDKVTGSSSLSSGVGSMCRMLILPIAAALTSKLESSIIVLTIVLAFFTGTLVIGNQV